MKPYPFASLNHLTVPCAIRLCPLSLGRGMARPRDVPGPPWPGVPHISGEQKSAVEDRCPRGATTAHTGFSLTDGSSGTSASPKNRVQISNGRNCCQGRCRRSEGCHVSEGGTGQRQAPGSRSLAINSDGPGLDLAHVRGLESLGALGDLELDLVSLSQALEPLGLDGAEVHEYVLAILLGDEAVPLRVVEPLHAALSHLCLPLLLRLCASVMPHHHGGGVLRE